VQTGNAVFRNQQRSHRSATPDQRPVATVLETVDFQDHRGTGDTVNRNLWLCVSAGVLATLAGPFHRHACGRSIARSRLISFMPKKMCYSRFLLN
jgi:hypothetical protein